MAVPDRFDEPVLVVSAASRALRRQLRPLPWVTLEDVALDAVAEDGRLVARTSARRVAEQLGVDPGTAAGALRVLRDRGLLVLEREQGPAGRFGLSVYVLGSVAGLTLVGAGAEFPHLRSPSSGDADGTEWVVTPDGRGADRRCITQPRTGKAHMDGPPCQPSLQCSGQETLDLGWGSA